MINIIHELIDILPKIASSFGEPDLSVPTNPISSGYIYRDSLIIILSNESGTTIELIRMQSKSVVFDINGSTIRHLSNEIYYIIDYIRSLHDKISK